MEWWGLRKGRDVSSDERFPNFPATSQNVLACGGTSLFLDNKNNRMNETTWSSAGCGISSIVSKPTYQNNIVKLNKYSNRAIPDIAGVANPNTGVLFVYDGVTSIVGGTSVSCPVFAGLLSNGISQRNNQGKQPLTTVLTSTSTNNIQSILYALTRDPSSYSTNFYDITVGNDGSFNASINYDVATGIGALNCQTITNTLANFTILKK
jgi:subtilase family serine protease